MKEIIDETRKGILPNYYKSGYYMHVGSITNIIDKHIYGVMCGIQLNSSITNSNYIYHESGLLFSYYTTLSRAQTEFNLVNSIKISDPKNYSLLLEKYVKKYFTEIDKVKFISKIFIPQHNEEFLITIIPNFQRETFTVKIEKYGLGYIKMLLTNDEALEKEFPGDTPIDTIGEYIRCKLNSYISKLIVNSLKDKL